MRLSLVQGKYAGYTGPELAPARIFYALFTGLANKETTNAWDGREGNDGKIDLMLQVEQCGREISHP